MSSARELTDPAAIRDACDLVVREGAARVDEADLQALLAELQGKQGEEWARARDAVHGALSAVRKREAQA